MDVLVHLYPGGDVKIYCCPSTLTGFVKLKLVDEHHDFRWRFVAANYNVGVVPPIVSKSATNNGEQFERDVDDKRTVYTNFMAEVPAPRSKEAIGSDPSDLTTN